MPSSELYSIPSYLPSAKPLSEPTFDVYLTAVMGPATLYNMNTPTRSLPNICNCPHLLYAHHIQFASFSTIPSFELRSISMVSNYMPRNVPIGHAALLWELENPIARCPPLVQDISVIIMLSAMPTRLG
eukprot:11800719-Ditylum_brightwellii.AAC.1